MAILRNLQRLLSGGRSGSAGYPFEMVVQDALLVLAAIGAVWLVRSARERPDLLPFLPLTVLTVLVASANTTWGIYPDGAGRMMLGLIPLYPLATRLRGQGWRILVTASCVVAVFLQVLFNSALAVM